jgi:hypothetical protein
MFNSEFSNSQESNDNYNRYEEQNDNIDVYLEVFKNDFDLNKEEDDDFDYSALYYIRANPNKNTKSSTPNKTIFEIVKNYQKKINEQLYKKKRGRQLEKTNKNKIKNTHDKFAYDNVLRKIQVHYISFLNSLVNRILIDLNYEEQFLKLNYDIKKKIKKDYIKELKNKKLSDIICSQISKKYKNYNSNFNTEIYNKIKDNDILKNLLNENYLTFFKNIYCKSEKTINLKKYGLEKEIILTNEVKMLNDLLKDNLDENIDNDKYLDNIYECIKENFYPDINKTKIKFIRFPNFQTSFN